MNTRFVNNTQPPYHHMHLQFTCIFITNFVICVHCTFEHIFYIRDMIAQNMYKK